MANLFESVQLGSLVLANRVFMAPLRATAQTQMACRANSRRLITHNALRLDSSLPRRRKSRPWAKATSILRVFIPPNRCAGGAESSNPFIRMEAESSFSCGTSDESLICPCCRTTNSQ
jgi:hypothetical protein